MQSYFNPDPKQIAERNKKREYFINKYSRDFSFNNIKEIESISISKSNKEVIEKEKANISFREGKDITPNKEQENGKGSVLNKSFSILGGDNNNKAKTVKKLRSKKMKSEVTTIYEYFGELADIEKKYGTMICNIGNPKFFNESIIFMEEDKQKHYYMKDLPPEEKKYIVKLIKDKNIKEFILPNWNIFKKGMKCIGKAHIDSADFIKKGVKDMINMFNHEYLNQSAQLKKERKELKEIYDKTESHLIKIGKEYTEQCELSKKLKIIYEEAKAKKEAPITLLNKENDVKKAVMKLGILLK